MNKMKEKQSVYTSRCSKCILYEKCKGFDRNYIERFGEGEFKPIKKIKKPKIKTVYEK